MLGVSGVQFDARSELRASELSETGRRQFLHQIDERNLRVSSLYFPTRRAFYDPDQLDARTAATKSAMEFAFQLKADVVCIRLGRIPVDSESDDYVTLCQVLDDLARHSNHVGSTLAITPTNDAPETIEGLLSKIDSGPIGVNFDPASFAMSDLNACEAYRLLHSRVIQFTVRDGLKDIDGSGLEVPVGRGEVDWDETIALIEESEYRSTMNIERNHGDQKIKDIANAAQYLESLAFE